jgi:hypothetical protein
MQQRQHSHACHKPGVLRGRGCISCWHDVKVDACGTAEAGALAVQALLRLLPALDHSANNHMEALCKHDYEARMQHHTAPCHGAVMVMSKCLGCVGQLLDALRLS